MWQACTDLKVLNDFSEIEFKRRYRLHSRMNFRVSISLSQSGDKDRGYLSIIKKIKNKETERRAYFYEIHS
jgi:hypothetical protein